MGAGDHPALAVLHRPDYDLVGFRRVDFREDQRGDHASHRVPGGIAALVAPDAVLLGAERLLVEVREGAAPVVERLWRDAHLVRGREAVFEELPGAWRVRGRYLRSKGLGERIGHGRVRPYGVVSRKRGAFGVLALLLAPFVARDVAREVRAAWLRRRGKAFYEVGQSLDPAVRRGESGHRRNRHCNQRQHRTFHHKILYGNRCFR